jgi:AraC-like DNA-binding protein
MSEQVVQQGMLPGGQLCFALLGDAAATRMRVQGQDFDAGHLLVLRGGQEFEIQRPAGVELLSVTVAEDAFADTVRLPPAAVIRPDKACLVALRQQVRAQVRARSDATPAPLLRAVRQALASAADVRPQPMSILSAASMVSESQRIALTEYREQPLRIEELCARLRTSRRTLQNSFRCVTGLSPVVYLRNMRLNAVRRRLMATTATELSVSHAAIDAGFDHLGHFAGCYRALFGEVPSATLRRPPPQRS